MSSWLLIIVVVAIALTVGFVLAAVIKGQRSRTVCQLELGNLGNVKSRYDLRAEDDTGLLKFRFTLGGVALPQRQVVAAAEALPAVGAPTSAATPAIAGAGAGDVPVASNTPAAGKSGVSVSGIAAFAGGIADLLNTVGYLLPSSLGTPLFQLGSRLQETQYTSQRMEHMRDQASSLGGSVRTAGESQAASPQPAAPQPFARRSAATRATVPAAAPALAASRVWVQTPFVEPGETCVVDLHLLPARFVSAQPMDCAFRVMSRSVDQADAPWTTDEWTVRVEGLSALSQNTPLLVILGIIAVVLILAAAFCVNSTGFLGR